MILDHHVSNNAFCNTVTQNVLSKLTFWHFKGYMI